MPRKRTRRTLVELGTLLFEDETAELVSDDVERISYVHVEEQRTNITRVHDFDPGVQMWALSNGGVLLLRGDGEPLWDEFEHR